MFKNILVVSYDVNLNYLITDVLKECDYKINFTDYNKSTEMMKNIKYYSVLLDMDIIDHSGIETLINIYSYAKFTPIIVLLNKDDNNIRTNLIKYGADDFILKNDLNESILEKTITYSVERNNFRDKINKSYSNLNNIFESIKDLILIVDLNCIIKYANTYAKTFFSIKNMNLIGSKYSYNYSLNELFEYHIKDRFYEVISSEVTWDEKNCIMLIFKDITDKKKYELATVENEKLLKNMIDLIDSGIILTDTITMKILEINPYMEKLLKAKRESVLSKSISNYIPINFDENLNISKMETVVKDAYGMEISVFISINNFKINDKKYFLYSIVDLTEEKDKERIIKKRIKYENLINKISYVFYDYEECNLLIKNITTIILDDFKLNSIIVYLKKIENIFSEILYSNIDIGDDINEIINILFNYRNSYLYYGEEKKIYYPIFYEKNVIGFIGLQNKNNDNFDEIDLDYYKIIANIISNGFSRIIDMEKLYNNHAMFYKILNTIPGPLFYKNNDGVFIGCNDKFSDLIAGLPVERIVGSTIFDLNETINNGQEKEYFENEYKLMNDLKIWTYQTSYKCKDGIIRDFIVYKSVYNNLKGEVAGSITFMLDISENERMKKQLIESEKLTAVGQLAAGVAHEFNNIMAIIKSTVQLIELKNEMNIINLDDETLKGIKTIDDSIKRASDIVSNLMGISKPEDTNLDYYRIGDLIDEVIKLQKKQFETENIKVEKFYEEVPDLFVDKGQIQQVFINLSINARHAMKKFGHGTISIYIKKSGDFVEITFNDTGTGIKDEIKDKIFLPFFSTKGAHSKDDSNIKGTGLGLSITQSIIKNHGGTIEIGDTAGKGASFIIKLPVVSMIKSKSRMFKEKVNNNHRSFNPDYKIAIIDYEEFIANNLYDILLLNGYQNVDVYYEAIIFLKKLNYQYDLIITIFFMSGMNGNDFIRKLDDWNINANVIFVTANIEEFNKVYIQSNRVISIIQKPFDMDKLLKIIDDASLKKK